MSKCSKKIRINCTYVQNHIHYHNKSSSFEINRNPKQFDTDCVFYTKINACNHHNNSSKTTYCDTNDSNEFEQNLKPFSNGNNVSNFKLSLVEHD